MRRGCSLLEFLVGLGVGLVTLVAVMQLYVGGSTTNLMSRDLAVALEMGMTVVHTFEQDIRAVSIARSAPPLVVENGGKDLLVSRVVAGGTDTDILDRQKARVNGHYSIIGDIKLTEDDLKNAKVSYLLGPIRLTRQVVFELKIEKYGVTLYTTEISFMKQYYPHFIHHIKANKRLDKDWGISLIRQSFDFNLNAIGMQFYNPDNYVLIDGAKDDMNRLVNLEPDLNWYVVTGNPGTIVNIFQVEDVGNTQEMYYWDSESGGTYDGTSETGYDDKSYGDTGVLLKGSNMEGSLGLPMHMYFFAANQDTSIGHRVVENYQTPLNVNTNTSSFTLPVVATTLPDTSQQQGFNVTVPIVIGDVSGLGLNSANISIQFDHTVVQAIYASTSGTIAEFWGEPTFDITTDHINLQLTGATPLTGSGVLVNLEFKVIGAEETQTALHFSEVNYNNGEILAETYDGSITALAPPEIAIALPDTAQEKGLSIAIPIYVSETTGLNVTSAQFQLLYDTSILDIKTANTTNTIAYTWTDIQLTKLGDGLQLTMAGDSPLEGSGDFIFLNFDVIGETGQITTLTFSNVIFNDGIPVAVPQNGSFTTLTPPEVLVSIPDTSAEQRSTIKIPISIGDITGLNVTAINMRLSFNGAVLDAVGAQSDGTMSFSWTELNFVDDENEIQLSLSGTEPLSGSGTLIFVEFNVVGNANETTPIEISHIQFNNGNPAGVVNNGTFTVLPAQIAVVLPDTSGLSGTTISIPVRVEDLTGLNVLSINMMISYDPQVLDAFSITTEGTLLDNRQPPTFNDFSNRAHIKISEENPIEGSGILCYINFDVIGADQAASALHFMYCIFNDGIPIAEKYDGSFTVSGVLVKVAISIPDTSAYKNQSIQIPIMVGYLTGLKIALVEIRISFDANVLDATGVSTTGTLSSIWGMPIYQDNGNSIYLRMADFELSGNPYLKGQGELIYLKFNVIGDAGSSTPLHFTTALFNSGDPVSDPDDGSCAVLETPQVLVSMPDTSGMSGTSIAIPISVDDVTGLDILSFQTKIVVNPQVLEAVGISTEGTLTADWNQIQFNKIGSEIDISMQDETPLAGDGVLALLNFNIIGSDSAASVIEFSDFTFNDGIPAAVTENGMFTISGVVPVELVSFNAILYENKIKLIWTTISESNNYGFEIQRRHSNQDWLKIGFIHGRGTTSIPHTYIYFDADVVNDVYQYRLKQIDFDGSYQYSSIITIAKTNPEFVNLTQNYPNPFNATTVVHYQIPNESVVEFKIFNLLGKQVYEVNRKQQPAGFYTIEWNGKDYQGNSLPSGVYIYQLRTNDSIITKKMILLE